MKETEVRLILANLRLRVELGEDGKCRLPGVITEYELRALDTVLRGAILSTPVGADSDPVVDLLDSVDAAKAPSRASSLDLGVLSLPQAPGNVRVCLDFGTAMSKATLVMEDPDTGDESIHVLRLGVPGDQEEVDDVMLISSVFVDSDGLVWFGKKAVDRARLEEESGRLRLDNIKRWLSEGNLGCEVDSHYNPSGLQVRYEELVLAYLSFFTWAVCASLEEQLPDVAVPRNVHRRFAMPCFPSAGAREVARVLARLLGEAQVMADTFGDRLHQGLPLEEFLEFARTLRSTSHEFPFIGQEVSEPLGVAGSLLSWRAHIDALTMVVDIGAGTSDFSLYRLALTPEEATGSARSTAMEVSGSARGITEAGNHLDQILKAYILALAGIDSTHPKFVNISYDLERDIRGYKETLFDTGELLVPLRTGDNVEISLKDFLGQDAVEDFKASLHATMTAVLESVDPSFVEWVRAHPQRNLTVVLTGGGATLPMARSLAAGPVVVRGKAIPVAPAVTFPFWLRDVDPDLEHTYPRIAVSLGGARKQVISSAGMATITGDGIGGHVLDRFPTKGV